MSQIGPSNLQKYSNGGQDSGEQRCHRGPRLRRQVAGPLFGAAQRPEGRCLGPDASCRLRAPTRRPNCAPACAPRRGGATHRRAGWARRCGRDGSGRTTAAHHPQARHRSPRGSHRPTAHTRGSAGTPRSAARQSGPWSARRVRAPMRTGPGAPPPPTACLAPQSSQRPTAPTVGRATAPACAPGSRAPGRRAGCARRCGRGRRTPADHRLSGRRLPAP